MKKLWFPPARSARAASLALFALFACFTVAASLPARAATPVLSSGHSHVMAIRDDGTLWSWGLGVSGQPGDGTTMDRNFAAQPLLIPEAAQVAAGTAHSVAIKPDGTMVAWGDNEVGQLGDGVLDARRTPGVVIGFGDGKAGSVKAIFAGNAHSFALMNDGKIRGWGWNFNQQLGDSSNYNRMAPIANEDIDEVATLAPGFAHTLALKKDGSVWAWGWNAAFQLGMAPEQDRSFPVKVPGLEGINAIAAGESFSMVVDRDGRVIAFGLNKSGQLGDGSNKSGAQHRRVKKLPGKATAIAAGRAHALALLKDGSVWAWGLNEHGQLGTGNRKDSALPRRVQGLSHVVAIAAGYAHSVAVKADGTIWTWGDNAHGQLGDGTDTMRLTPVQVRTADGKPFSLLTKPATLQGLR